MKHYTKENGLPSDSLQSIHQTSDGFVWIASKNNGLLQFDGEGGDHFTIPNGLKDDNVQVLYEDKGNQLWVATANGGIGRIQGDSVAYPHKNALFQQHRITDIAEDYMPRLWLGSANAGIFVGVHSLAKHLTKRDGLPSNTIHDLWANGEKQIWAATSRGVAVIDTESLKVIRQLPALSGENCSAIFEDRHGIIWIGTSNGLVQIKGGSSKRIEQVRGRKVGTVTDITQNRFGSVLVSTSQNGIYRFGDQGVQNISAENDILRAPVTDLFSDSEGRTWIATKSKGAYLLLDEAFVRYEIPRASSATALHMQQDTLWMASRAGLFMMDTKKKKIQRHTLNGVDGTIWDIESFSGDRLLLATDRNLYSYDHTGGRVVKNLLNKNSQKGHIYDIHVSRNGTIFVGTDGGIYQLKSGRLEQLGTQGVQYTNRIYWHIMEDHMGDLWLSTSKGMLRYTGGKLKALPKLQADGLSGMFRYSVEDKKGNIWMGSNQGIIYYQRNDTTASVQLFDNHFGLFSVDTQFLTIDRNDQLWHGTSAGLHKLDIAKYWHTGEIEVKHYGLTLYTQGLQFNHRSIASKANGELWFGSKQGIIGYNPKYKLENSGEPQVYFSDIRLGLNQEQQFEYKTRLELDYPTSKPPKITLSNQENNLTFEFNGLDYEAPHKLVYRYRLKGKQREWSEPSEAQKVVYKDLVPGEYTFEVQAQEGDGQWSTQPASFTFTIAKSIWSTYWFNILLVAGIAGILYGSSRVWLNAYEKEKLQHLVDYQTKELREGLKEKEVLLAEIHHRVKNNLAVISGLLELQQDSVMEPSAVRALVEAKTRIKSIAMIHEKLYKNDTLANINFRNYIRELAEIIARSFNKEHEEVTLHVDTDDILITIDQSIPCGLILNELLCNSYEHAFDGRAKGNIWISLNENGEYVNLIIADDGRGLPNDWKKKRSETLGLTLVKTLTQQLGGQLTVVNEEGAHFEVQFQKELTPKGHLGQG